MAIKKALQKIDRKALIENLVSTGLFSAGSINTAFSRGKIPVAMVSHMEKFTSISAKFWLVPEVYDTNGDRR